MPDIWTNPPEDNEPTSRLLLRRANAFRVAAQKLAQEDLPHGAPIVVLAHHAIEMSLKAVLRGHDIPINEIKLKYRHDLGELARRSGIPWNMNELEEIRSVGVRLHNLRYPDHHMTYFAAACDALSIMETVFTRCAAREGVSFDR